jgi:hypothetical protein
MLVERRRKIGRHSRGRRSIKGLFQLLKDLVLGRLPAVQLETEVPKTDTL